ncbi:MAG: hypothetical protein WC796_00475 [Candidatus Pacearchaeota archaeon]|jgi:hypothetical protein
MNTTTLRGKAGRGLAAIVFSLGLGGTSLPAHAGDAETFFGSVTQGLGGIAQDSARTQVDYNRGKLLESVGKGVSAIGEQDAMRDSAPKVVINNTYDARNAPKHAAGKRPKYISENTDNVVQQDQDVLQRVIIKNTWLECNVVQDGEEGLRVHNYFIVGGLQMVQLFDYFWLCDRNGEAITENGKQVFSKIPFTPPFPETAYRDSTLFIPYSRLNRVVQPGKTTLRIKTGVVYEGSGSIEERKVFAESNVGFEIDRK